MMRPLMFLFCSILIAGLRGVESRSSAAHPPGDLGQERADPWGENVAFGLPGIDLPLRALLRADFTECMEREYVLCMWRNGDSVVCQDFARSVCPSV